jgi:hypothetical protein
MDLLSYFKHKSIPKVAPHEPPLSLELTVQVTLIVPTQVRTTILVRSVSNLLVLQVERKFPFCLWIVSMRRIYALVASPFSGLAFISDGTGAIVSLRQSGSPSGETGDPL